MMNKNVWILLLAVLLPSAVLGWLALRGAEEQMIILERRTASLFQGETEKAAAGVRAVIAEQREGFASAVRRILAEQPAQKAGADFPRLLNETWERESVGFVLGLDGKIVSPQPATAATNTEQRRVLWDHLAFLAGQSAATVYPVPLEELTNLPEITKARREQQQLNFNVKNKTASNYSLRQDEEPPQPMDKVPADSPQAPAAAAPAPALAPAPAKSSAPQATLDTPYLRGAAVEKKFDAYTATISGDAMAESKKLSTASTSKVPSTKAGTPGNDYRARSNAIASKTSSVMPALEPDNKDTTKIEAVQRAVAPQQVILNEKEANWSTLLTANTGFLALCQEAEEGMVTRFVQNKLNLIFWLRPPQNPNLVFGCVLDAATLSDLWPDVLPGVAKLYERSSRGDETEGEFVVALLDDQARPVSVSNDIGVFDWKRPFVATAIGEALPHWEAALYLRRPEQLRESARSYHRTLIFLVAVAVAAIACGGWLVVSDARRQLALAQQKTDFVSNVSHELKTPLTSIRMFAEMMLGGKVSSERIERYLRVILFESERLTRLINNVLDFAKLERRQRQFDKRGFDLRDVLGQVWESHAPHLSELGFNAACQFAEQPCPVHADADAVTQILVNLFSNAEKYGGDGREISVRQVHLDTHVEVQVMDRGPGVPRGQEGKIFDAFVRAHDSLASGIQGSGLGLTLARQLAREHGGDVTYAAREGGGSVFTFKLPLQTASTSA